MKASDYFEDTPVQELAEAAARGDAAAVMHAVDVGADPNTIGRESMTPLFFAIGSSRNLSGVRALLKAGADASALIPSLGCAVTVAAAAADPALLETLLESGADANAKNNAQEPAIMVAVLNDRHENLELLLSHGADVDATDYGGETILTTLASLNNYEHVARLIERGADIHHVADNGATVANRVQRGLKKLDPKSSHYQWAQRVKAVLEERGVEFPAPTAVQMRKSLQDKP